MRLVARHERPADEREVQTLERYQHAAPNLIRLNLLAKPGSPSRFTVLDEISGDFSDQLIDPQRVDARVARILANRPAQVAAHAAALSIQTAAAPVGSVATTVESAYQVIQAMRIDEEQPLFPDARVHLVHIDGALSARCTFARLLVRAQAEPQLYEVAPSESAAGRRFASARGLHRGLDFLDPYLTPVLLAHSPYVWAFSAVRIGGVILYDFGRCVNGTLGEAAELLQMFGPPGVVDIPQRPNINQTQIDAALAWWISRINRLLGTVTDPVLYRAGGGEHYSPQGHLQVLLTIEQLFRHVQSILTQPRDTHDRRLLLFGFLDTLEKLTGHDPVTRFTAAHAEATLENLETAITGASAEVLLPSCRRAVAALHAVQDGFFLSTGSSHTIRVPTKSGGTEDMPLPNAAAHYLHVLRNATHGFGGKNDATRRRNETLLAAHAGDLPDDLPLLAYLYLLQLLANTEDCAASSPPNGSHE